MLKLACLLVIFVSVTFVSCTNVALLYQYHQCKLLKMIPINNTMNGQGILYIPDPQVPNNTLNDAYFKNNLGLDSKTIDDAFEIMKKIYDEINNCNNLTCVCIKSYVLNDFDDYSGMFRNFTFMIQAKRIVSAFIEKYKSFILSENEIANLIQSFGLYYPPTLIRFMAKFDASLQRLFIYKDSVRLSEFAPMLGLANIDLSVQIAFL